MKLEYSIDQIIGFTSFSVSSSGINFMLLNGAMGLVIVKPSSVASEEFAPYLAGLIEGDGSIIVPEHTTKSYRPFFEIVFHIEDLQLA